MATVLLTGDFSEAVTTTDTEVADARSIVLRLLSTIVLDNGDVHSPQRWIVSLTAGAFSRYLVVPDDATAARYSIILPDGTEHVFTLASSNGPTITVAAVLLLNLVDIEPDALAALLALYTPLATYTAHAANTSNPHSVTAAQVGAYTSGAVDTLLSAKEGSLGNPGTNGYVLSSLTNGTRSWIAPGGGGGGTTVTYSAWANLTLENSWGNLNVIPSGYRKVTIGGVDMYVELRGEIFRSPFVSGLTIATLPSGFRPPTNWRQQFKIFSNTGDGQIIIKDTGVIESYTGGTALDLSNVRIYLV